MNVKYLILGKGYFGKKFNAFFNNSVLSEERINSSADAEKEILKYNPKYVINCIGRTGRPNIDWCEDHKEETLEVNTVLPFYIYLACKKHDVKMVHLSSGCIYEGNNGGKGFSEEDEPNFLGSFYSRSKIYAEKILKEFPVLQIRIRMPIDSEKEDRNLITKILKYNKIISIPNSITVVEDLLNITKKLLDMDKTGIYNVVNKGHMTHKEMLDIYESYSGKKIDYEIISLAKLESFTKARRSNCILSIKKLEDAGISVPEVRTSIEKVIKTYVERELK